MPDQRPIKLLGELALRVNDLAAMTTFYTDVVGLEMYSDLSPRFVFLKIADAVEGHPQIFGLFDRSISVDQARTTIDHFAFIIDLEDYDTEAERLAEHGVAVMRKTFPGFSWRSLFFSDPEGNTVEFVAYDPAVRERQDSSP